MELYDELRIAALANSVPSFDGSDNTKYPAWKKGIQRCQPELSTKGLRSLMFRTLTGAALSVFSRETTDDKGEYKPDFIANNIFTTLEKTFYPQVGINTALQQLMTSKQKQGEAVATFAEKMRMLAAQAFSPEELNSPMRQTDLYHHFLNGLADESLQMRIMNIKNRTLDDAVAEAIQFEARTKALRELHAKPSLAQPKQVTFAQVASISQDKAELKAALSEIATEVLTPLLGELRISRRDRYSYQNRDRSRSPYWNRDYDRNRYASPARDRYVSPGRDRYMSPHRNRYFSPGRDRYYSPGRERPYFREYHEPSHYDRNDNRYGRPILRARRTPSRDREASPHKRPRQDTDMDTTQNIGVGATSDPHVHLN